MASPEPTHLVRRFAARKQHVADRDAERMLGQRSVSLTALHANAPLEPRMAQLETLEAKMASIEVSLSAAARRKKPGGSLGSARSHAQLDSPQPPGRSHSVMETSCPAALHEEALRSPLREASDVRGASTARMSGERERLARLRLEMDGKRLAIKNLKLALTRLHVTDNIDVRIQQAELEFQLGREELNLLTCLEQSRALTLSLEEAGRTAAADTATLHAAVSGVSAGQLVSLHAATLRCAGSSLKFGAGARDGCAGLWVQWAAPGCGLHKGDRLVEVNGVSALQRSKEQLQRLLAAAEPALLVVMRCTADRAATLASNVRLTHRISYLEDQVAQLLSTDRASEPERPGSAQAVFQKGRVTALVAEPELHSTTLHVRAAAAAAPKPSSPGPASPTPPHENGIGRSQPGKDQGPTNIQELSAIRKLEFNDQGTAIKTDFKDHSANRTQELSEQGLLRIHDLSPMRKHEYIEQSPLRKQEFMEQSLLKKQEFNEQRPARKQDYYEQSSLKKQDISDQSQPKMQEYNEQGPMRKQEYNEQSPMRKQDYKDPSAVSIHEFKEKIPVRPVEYSNLGALRTRDVKEHGPIRSYESKLRLFGPQVSDNRVPRSSPASGREAVGEGTWRSADNEGSPRDDVRLRDDFKHRDEHRVREEMRQKDEQRLREELKHREDHRIREDIKQREDRRREELKQREDHRREELKQRDDHRLQEELKQREDQRLRDDYKQREDHRHREDLKQREEYRREDLKQREDHRLREEARLREDLDYLTARKAQLSAFLEDRKFVDERKRRSSGHEEEAFRAASVRSGSSLERPSRAGSIGGGEGWASDRYASDSGRPPPPRKPARLSLHKALSLSSVATPTAPAPRKPAKRRHKQAAPPLPRQEKWC